MKNAIYWQEGQKHRDFLHCFSLPFYFKEAQQIFGSQITLSGLHCSFLCLSRSCSSPPAWSTLPWLLLLHGLDFSWEKKTFGASSIVEEYKEMPENCRNISWSSQTKLNLGGFWGKIRDCSSIFRKEVAHGLGFSRASAVQGINLGWLHPKKLDAILCSPRGFLSLRYLVFGVEKWNLGLHNPTSNNCSEPKITQAAPGVLPKKEAGGWAFLGLLGHF